MDTQVINGVTYEVANNSVQMVSSGNAGQNPITIANGPFVSTTVIDEPVGTETLWFAASPIAAHSIIGVDNLEGDPVGPASCSAVDPPDLALPIIAGAEQSFNLAVFTTPFSVPTPAP